MDECFIGLPAGHACGMSMCSEFSEGPSFHLREAMVQPLGLAESG